MKTINITLLEYVAAPRGASHPSFPSAGETEPPGSPGGRGGGAFLQAGLNSRYKADPINLCGSGLRC